MAAAPPPADEARGAEATTPPALDPNSPEAQSAELLNAVVGQIFSTRRPRDVCAGAASAFKSVAKGFALGVATLIAAPAAAAYNQPEEEQQPQQPPQTTLAKLGTRGRRRGHRRCRIATSRGRRRRLRPSRAGRLEHAVSSIPLRDGRPGLGR